jgi:hypothetical protein
VTDGAVRFVVAPTRPKPYLDKYMREHPSGVEGKFTFTNCPCQASTLFVCARCKLALFNYVRGGWCDHARELQRRVATAGWPGTREAA